MRTAWSDRTANTTNPSAAAVEKEPDAPWPTKSPGSLVKLSEAACAVCAHAAPPPIPGSTPVMTAASGTTSAETTPARVRACLSA